MRKSEHGSVPGASFGERQIPGSHRHATRAALHCRSPLSQERGQRKPFWWAWGMKEPQSVLPGRSGDSPRAHSSTHSSRLGGNAAHGTHRRTAAPAGGRAGPELPLPAATGAGARPGVRSGGDEGPRTHRGLERGREERLSRSETAHSGGRRGSIRSEGPVPFPLRYRCPCPCPCPRPRAHVGPTRPPPSSPRSRPAPRSGPAPAPTTRVPAPKVPGRRAALPGRGRAGRNGPVNKAKRAARAPPAPQSLPAAPAGRGHSLRLLQLSEAPSWGRSRPGPDRGPRGSLRSPRGKLSHAFKHCLKAQKEGLEMLARST